MLSPGSGNTVIKSKLISRRMFLLTAAKAVVMVGLVGRLISLQINQATKYKSLSDKNRFREWKLAPERGVIKDFFDQELASNEPLYQVHLVPENTKNLNQLFVRLKAILNIKNGLDQKISGDLLSVDINEALMHLGEITGEITTEDLLGDVFANFCIGK